MNKNCLSYWYPKLVAAGVPVPRTEVVRTDCELVHILDGRTPDGWADFISKMDAAITSIATKGTPIVFLRTGQGSGKHQWKHTCRFDLSTDILANHIAALVEWSHCADFLGLAHNVWAVRELLPTKPVFVLEAYGDMPLVPEVRSFVRDGKVVCWHPYWPEGSIREGLECSHLSWASDCPRCEQVAADLYQQTAAVVDTDEWRPLAECVAKAFARDGAWSVDLLPTDRGWFVTDLATAKDSFHSQDCPHEKEFKR